MAYSRIVGIVALIVAFAFAPVAPGVGERVAQCIVEGG